LGYFWSEITENLKLILHGMYEKPAVQGGIFYQLSNCSTDENHAKPQRIWLVAGPCMKQLGL
jgi:hypothetical protein